eukprot:6207422-Pleurochrysis_carterae.AAC.7
MRRIRLSAEYGGLAARPRACAGHSARHALAPTESACRAPARRSVQRSVVGSRRLTSHHELTGACATPTLAHIVRHVRIWTRKACQCGTLAAWGWDCGRAGPDLNAEAEHRLQHWHVLDGGALGRVVVAQDVSEEAHAEDAQLVEVAQLRVGAPLLSALEVRAVEDVPERHDHRLHRELDHANLAEQRLPLGVGHALAREGVGVVAQRRDEDELRERGQRRAQLDLVGRRRRRAAEETHEGAQRRAEGLDHRQVGVGAHLHALHAEDVLRRNKFRDKRARVNGWRGVGRPVMACSEAGRGLGLERCLRPCAYRRSVERVVSARRVACDGFAAGDPDGSRATASAQAHCCVSCQVGAPCSLCTDQQSHV